MRVVPSIQSPAARQWREIWRRYSAGHEVRTLIIEIVRMRQVVAEVEEYRQIVHTVWNEDTGRAGCGHCYRTMCSLPTTDGALIERAIA
ncbi:hypothetical protein C2U71_27440 [Burkholderia ubonensis]|nr:hypothetical protein C2U71_27440 [Burkholderia ubonensis]